MSENFQTEMPVTISVDLDAFAKHVMRGYYYGEDEPQHALDPITKAVVDRLVTDLRKTIADEVTEAAQAEIRSQVKEIVAETLHGEYATTDTFGVARGRTSLREQIGKEIGAWADKRTGDYGRGSSLMEKFIKENVDRAMQADLKEAVEQNREVLKSHMRNAAAALLAAEAAKR